MGGIRGKKQYFFTLDASRARWRAVAEARVVLPTPALATENEEIKAGIKIDTGRGLDARLPRV